MRTGGTKELMATDDGYTKGAGQVLGPARRRPVGDVQRRGPGPCTKGKVTRDAGSAAVALARVLKPPSARLEAGGSGR
ncbi:hypothetical protein GCM10010276_21480 [Streptomyces longisporus]|uniref:Uncharacterized protein n=1 Tax=Streptomyces longisporus TaxID=1948 RepID=A0ABP5YRJ6_STRLO